MPLRGQGYNVGKKVPQIGGNSPNVKPAGRSIERGGNTSNAGKAPKNNKMNGNYVPGARLNP